MFFIPVLDNPNAGTFTVKSVSGESPNGIFSRLGWVRRFDLDSTNGRALQSPSGAVIRFGNYDAAIEYLRLRGLGEKMRPVRVHYKRLNGGPAGYYDTAINGTDKSIARYFDGMPVTVGLSDDPNAVVTRVTCPIYPNHCGHRPIIQQGGGAWCSVLPFVDGTTAAPWVVWRDDYDRATIEDNERPRAGWLSRVPDQYLVSLSEAVARWGYTLAKPAGAVGLPLLKFAALIQQRAGEAGPRDRDLKLAADIRAAVLHNYESSRRNLAARKWGTGR